MLSYISKMLSKSSNKNLNDSNNNNQIDADQVGDDVIAHIPANQLVNGEMSTLADYQDLELLATGSFGRVFLVKHKKFGTYYAMKTLKKSDVIKSNQVEQARAERDLLLSMNHPFVVRLYATFHSATRLYYLMEYLPGGDMFFLLRRTKRFPNRVAIFYATEVLLALECCHSFCIVYRDIKPENILIDAEGHTRLADFGFAKRLAGPNGRTKSLVGTPEYVAPEIISSEPQTLCVDWWSFGVLCYEMLAGRVPFYGQNPFDTYSQILQGIFTFPAYVKSDAKDLIKKLLVRNPERRLGWKQGAADLKKHSWFDGVDWDLALTKQALRVPWKPVLSHAGDSIQFRRANQAESSLVQSTSVPAVILAATPKQVPMTTPAPSPAPSTFSTNNADHLHSAAATTAGVGVVDEPISTPCTLHLNTQQDKENVASMKSAAGRPRASSNSRRASPVNSARSPLVLTNSSALRMSSKLNQQQQQDLHDEFIGF